MPQRIAPETVALIHALWAKGLSVLEIHQGVGVSDDTVRRYLGMLSGAATRRHEAKRPLFDPVRDGVPDLPVTAALCGDPLPGRRELVAKNRIRENVSLVDLDE